MLPPRAVAGTGLNKLVDFNDKNSPVSAMLVNGRPQVMSFDKNDDHHQGRDHLLIYPTDDGVYLVELK